MSVQYVKIYYGPHESFYTLSHKPQKLKGLRDYLQRLGFRVDIVPVEFVNYCVIEMCGYEVFRCNIKNLSFNTQAEHDPVCRRAINAIMSSSAKLSRARTYVWFWALLEDQIFRRNIFAPKDYWPFDVDTTTLIQPLECFTCCGVQETANKLVDTDSTSVGTTKT